MAKRARFVLNRAAFRAQVLKSPEMQAHLADRLRATAPPGTRVEPGVTTTRARARLVDDRDDATDREARTGHLTRALRGPG